MNIATRELYRSPNGDRWLLAREPGSNRVFIMHRANLPSGGKLSEVELADFLRPSHSGPEHQALMRLIGTLVEHPPKP